MQSHTEEHNHTAQPQTHPSLWQSLFGAKAPTPSRKALPFKPIDWIAMLVITIFYAIIAFYNLGNRFAPQTQGIVMLDSSLEFSGKEDTPIASLCWYLLDEEDITFKLETRNVGDTEWTFVQDFTMVKVFSWGRVDFPEPADYVRITNITDNALIGELALLDTDGNLLALTDEASETPFFDEQDTFSGIIDYMSNCYFDEIYYTRTAYEFTHGLITYEVSHPPMGKILITLGTMLFGFNPFGFRFMGTLFGVLMLPFIYLLGRNVTQNRGIGAFVCFIFAFDFMHFTQTRITTIDVFITFFVIVMFYFMERYIHLSFYDTSLWKTWIPLGACGIAFGFGIATKWPGFYAGAGLAVLFFAQLFLRYREYRYALASPNDTTDNISHAYIISSFKKNTLKTILFCLVFYIAIPATIYILSYLPVVSNLSDSFLDMVWDNQVFMFTYHYDLVDTHRYSSKWYEWPTMVRPVLYYINHLGGIARQGISALGNPLVWWAGIPAFIYMLYLGFRHRDKTAVFLCTSYLAQYLPWTLVPRYTFIYHYFPCVPFLALMIGYSFLQLQKITVGKKLLDNKSFYCLLIIYAAAVFALFQLFYPVLSGETISYEYGLNLRWLKDWVLIIP